MGKAAPLLHSQQNYQQKDGLGKFGSPETGGRSQRVVQATGIQGHDCNLLFAPTPTGSPPSLLPNLGKGSQGGRRASRDKPPSVRQSILEEFLPLSFKPELKPAFSLKTSLTTLPNFPKSYYFPLPGTYKTLYMHYLHSSVFLMHHNYLLTHQCLLFYTHSHTHLHQIRSCLKVEISFSSLWVPNMQPDMWNGIQKCWVNEQWMKACCSSWPADKMCSTRLGI